eukprot:GHVU01100033.1.p2 GENE.GHVU01100033.1~~GHVU01100033.1.p2  ORF type:complete len:155 (-),score=5.34 GHVU01100033.1:67-531(-)
MHCCVCLCMLLCCSPAICWVVLLGGAAGWFCWVVLLAGAGGCWAHWPAAAWRCWVLGGWLCVVLQGVALCCAVTRGACCWPISSWPTRNPPTMYVHVFMCVVGVALGFSCAAIYIYILSYLVSLLRFSLCLPRTGQDRVGGAVRWWRGGEHLRA